MAYISLVRLSHALGSNAVSGMAQKVGLSWPPPPVISVRNLAMLAGGQVSTLAWVQANPSTILVDQAQDAWHAGHVNDVLALDTGGIVAGTETGGVWLVNNDNNALPLSDGWDQPNINCLAFGPDGSRHIYAGGTTSSNTGSLYQTDVSSPLPLLNWQPVSLTAVKPDGASIGVVNRIAVLKQSRRIVLATSSGIFWSTIKDQGKDYAWQQVPYLPQGNYAGLAVGLNDRIVVAAWGADTTTGFYGIFHADWTPSGDLLPFGSVVQYAKALGANSVSGIAQNVGLTWPPPPAISLRGLLARSRLPLPQAGQSPTFGWGMGRTSLASSVQDNRGIIYIYAVSAQLKTGSIYAVLASSDSGASWSQVTIPNFPVPFNQGYYNNCMAVSPFNSQVVALGWQKSFLSRDSGKTWQMFDFHAGLPGLHDDVHAVYFDATQPPVERLYVGSDGGIALTTDQGGTFASQLNKNLLNLQFYGGKFAVSSQTPGLVAGATQDNGNMYCTVGGNTTPWTSWEGGDGGIVTFVATGELLHYYKDQEDGSLLHVAQWDGSRLNDLGLVSSNGLPDIPHAGLCSAITLPTKRNAAGQLMLAVASGDSTGKGVYGIFPDGSRSGMHYELLGQVPTGLGLGPITALGSADGKTVFAGREGGLMYAINTDLGTVQPLTVIPLKDQSEGDVGASIDRIVVLSDNLAFAILSNSRFAGGQNFILRWDGTSWNAVGVSQGLPGDKFFALEATNPRPLFTLFAATDNALFESDDSGGTWQIQGGGLPARPHCADLRFSIEPTGARFLYLSTYGRSVWRTGVD